VLQFAQTFVFIRGDDHHGRLAVLGHRLRLAPRSLDDLAEPVLCVLDRPTGASHGNLYWLDFLART
jgi:hypothetical protein